MGLNERAPIPITTTILMPREINMAICAPGFAAHASLDLLKMQALDDAHRTGLLTQCSVKHTEQEGLFCPGVETAKTHSAITFGFYYFVSFVDIKLINQEYSQLQRVFRASIHDCQVRPALISL